MLIGRRAFLKVLGGATVASGGYLTYDEMTSGEWLYDPEELTAARNKFFGIVDFETIYEVQKEYGEVPEDGVGTTGTNEVDPSDIGQMAGVGATSISGDNGVPTGVFSMAVTGSFDADVINDPADESPMLEEVDQPR